MQKLGEHAVVLGASVAGLLASRVLADFYGTVTVIERDVLPTEPVSRRGVPQGRMVHALQARGSDIMDELFPGLVRELVAEGVPEWDSRDFSKISLSVGGHRVGAGGSSTRGKALVNVFPSRPFLEWHVGQRVQAIPNVTILEGYDVAGLMVTLDRKRVIGARAVRREDGFETSVTGDLVVDATGRGSRTPAFLEELGYGRPPEDELAIHLTYASQLLRIPSGAVDEHQTVVFPEPGRPRLMVLLENERDTWMFAVGGLAGVTPPKQLDDRLAFVADFTPAHVLDAIRAAESLGEVGHYRVPSNRWRRYDKMRRTPDGLLVIGDAICSFNPIYGQGMTVAAVEALDLRECLRNGDRGLPRRFFRATAKSLRTPWRLTVGSDLALPEVVGPRSLSVRVSNALINVILTAAERDVDCALSFMRIIEMVDSPLCVLRPTFVFRVVNANIRRLRAPRTLQQRAPLAPQVK